MEVFSTTLGQMAYLFSLIVIGYLLVRINVLPGTTAGALSKLENTVFIPALVMGTFIKNFTVESLNSFWKLMLYSIAVLAVVIPLSMFFARICTKDAYIRNIEIYGLCFSNFAFMGNAVVSALFPDIFLDYLIFTLPLWAGIYLWGAPSLLIAESGEKTFGEKMKSFLNPMFVGMLIGMFIGLVGLELPAWTMNVITTCGNCMSPIAMLITGMTIAGIDLRATFTSKDVYLASFVRLAVFPLIAIGACVLLPLPRTYEVCTVCAMAMPFGLNSIVIPAAYGKDTSAASGMALVSHLIACGTIPLIFMLLSAVL